MNTAAFTAYREKVVSNCARVIVGKEDATEKILVSFLCGGHVLLEDKPGTGKTMLLNSFYAPSSVITFFCILHCFNIK